LEKSIIGYQVIKKATQAEDYWMETRTRQDRSVRVVLRFNQGYNNEEWPSMKNGLSKA
jgi:hypothetical protein